MSWSCHENQKRKGGENAIRHIVFQLALVALLAIGILVVMNRSVQAAPIVIICPGCQYVHTTQQIHYRCRGENEVACSWILRNYKYVRDMDVYDCDGQLTYYCHNWRFDGCCWFCETEEPECESPTCAVLIIH